MHVPMLLISIRGSRWTDLGTWVLGKIVAHLLAGAGHMNRLLQGKQLRSIADTDRGIQNGNFWQ